MAEVVYVLCALTSALCAALLTRGWLATHVRLLLWSAICFVILTLNNVLLVVDLVFLEDSTDLSTVRTASGLVGLLVLLYGLIYDRQSGGRG
jgi:hypothetical protein